LEEEEEEEGPSFGRGFMGELPPSDDKFEYNSEDGVKLTNLGIRWWRMMMTTRGRQHCQRKSQTLITVMAMMMEQM
jgi:hypothetical protein